MPQLSVIVPAYNSEKSLKPCLEAVRNSAYKDYELIVVDCGSRDGTSFIAKKYADKVIVHHKNPGRLKVRYSGIMASSGEAIVNVDSDVIVKPDTFTKINDYLSEYQKTDAVTGSLSKEHPHADFFSQYKNLYMNYIFSKLPERVTFLTSLGAPKSKLS